MKGGWLSPADVQAHYSLKRTISYQLIKEFRKSGGEVITIGKLTRVPEQQFTQFLINRGNK